MTDRHPPIAHKIGENMWAVWPSTQSPPKLRRAYRKAERRAIEAGRRFAEDVARRQAQRDERCT
jgi:hypothetical protein